MVSRTILDTSGHPTGSETSGGSMPSRSAASTKSAVASAPRTLLNAAKSQFSGSGLDFGADYKKLSEIAHPNDASFRSCLDLSVPNHVAVKVPAFEIHKGEARKLLGLALDISREFLTVLASTVERGEDVIKLGKQVGTHSDVPFGKAEMVEMPLGDHPNPAIEDHLKTGQRAWDVDGAGSDVVAPADGQRFEQDEAGANRRTGPPRLVVTANRSRDRYSPGDGQRLFERRRGPRETSRALGTRSKTGQRGDLRPRFKTGHRDDHRFRFKSGQRGDHRPARP